MAFLDLTNVRKSFAQSTAVENFNLEVERGEFISFLGPSGCGKTTTLRMIAGFETPTSGKIEINGVDVTNTPPNRRHVGMVFQSYALFPNMTVAGNVGFGLKVARQPENAIKERVAEMLRIVHLSDFGNRYPYQMSGGQQQRVALARALAIQPQVLLLDEPLSALDAKIRVSLRNEIRTIQRQLGITTIYVTHDQEEAPTTRFVASFVGTLNVLSADVADAASGRLRVDGQDIQAAKPIADTASGKLVSVALRPEVITLHGNGANGNHLSGTVDDVMFLGPTMRVKVRLRDQFLQFDEFNNPQLAPPQRGQQVTVSFPLEACLLLADQ